MPDRQSQGSYRLVNSPIGALVPIRSHYYGPGDCGWVRVRVLRHGHRVVRRVWRCW